MSYAKWEDLILRYKELNKVGGDAEINSGFIGPAEKQLDSMLGQFFTVPFSSNNYTATDLTIELTYVRYYESINPKKAAAKMKSIMGQIAALKSGAAVMIVTSGDNISANKLAMGSAYSNTMSYSPIFGIGNIEEFHPNSAQLYDEEIARDY